MAETVYLNDGSMECVFDEKDIFLERLLRERLGDDAARFFRAYIAELLDDTKACEEAQKEAESITDHYHALCNEALDNFRHLRALVQQPRLDRAKLQKAVDAGYDALYKNL